MHRGLAEQYFLVVGWRRRQREVGDEGDLVAAGGELSEQRPVREVVAAVRRREYAQDVVALSGDGRGETNTKQVQFMHCARTLCMTAGWLLGRKWKRLA